MATPITERDLPLELTAEQSVEAAYADVLAEVASKRRSDLSVGKRGQGRLHRPRQILIGAAELQIPWQRHHPVDLELRLKRLVDVAKAQVVRRVHDHGVDRTGDRLRPHRGVPAGPAAGHASSS